MQGSRIESCFDIRSIRSSIELGVVALSIIPCTCKPSKRDLKLLVSEFQVRNMLMTWIAELAACVNKIESESTGS